MVKKTEYNDAMAETVDDAIDLLGFKKFTVILILVVSVFMTGEATELNLMSIISPQLRCLWNLSDFETSFLSSVTFFGMSLGNFYWGFLSDMHGRKMMLVLGAFLSVYFGLLSSACNSYVWYIVCRFFVGIGLGSVAFILNYVGEYVMAKHRGKSAMFVDFFYAFGSIYVAIVALLLMPTSSWRAFLIVMTIPPFLFLLASQWLPESIHYLKNVGKYDRIVKILQRISVTNNVPMPSINFECQPTSKRGELKILFSKEYRRNMIIMIILFITAQCNYFGLVLMNTELLQSNGFCSQSSATNPTTRCSKLNTNDYMQNIYVALAELPGILIPVFLVDKIGRKPCLFAGYLISSVGYFCMNMCLSNLQGTVLMFILRAIGIALTIIPYVLCTELFPTVVRTSALGIFTGISRLVMIGVPFVVESLIHISKLASTLIFAMACFLSSALILFLPETKDSFLKDK